MDDQRTTAAPDPARPTPAPADDPRRRSGAAAGGMAWVLVLVVLGLLLVVRLTLGDSSDDPAVTTGAPTQGPGWDVERPIGATARLPDGSVARLNAVEPDAVVEPGLPAPEAGTDLYRIDVELCAGLEPLFVDSAFWMALGDDNVVHSPHMGVRDLVTLTMAPGSCQRGLVDLALPEAVGLQAVLLVDTTRTTVASWAYDREEAPGELETLTSGADPEVLEPGGSADLMAGGAVTLHAVQTTDGEQRTIQIDGEVCADPGDLELPTSPWYWFLQLEDHRLVAAERDSGTMEIGVVAPESCDRGSAVFGVPADATPMAIVYATGGNFEEARWALDGPPGDR